MKIERITTGEPPVTVARLAEFLRVPNTDPDLEHLILTAAAEIEEHANIGITDQTVEVETDHPPGAVVQLPVVPLSETAPVVIETIDNAGNLVPVVTGFVVRGGRHPEIRFTGTPPTDRVRVTYTAGFGEDHTSVPADLAHAVLDHAAFLYDMRAGLDGRKHNGLSPAAAHIAARYRRVRA